MSQLDGRIIVIEDDEAKKQHMEAITAADEALQAAEASLQLGRQRLLNAMKKYEQRGRLHGVPKRPAPSL